FIVIACRTSLTAYCFSLSLHDALPIWLAGGSSNAAAVLFGMNRMFRLGLKQEELMARGVRLGADVPYCIMRGTVLAEGTSAPRRDRKSTRLNSSHVSISYAVFCLKNNT